METNCSCWELPQSGVQPVVPGLVPSLFPWTGMSGGSSGPFLLSLERLPATCSRFVSPSYVRISGPVGKPHLDENLSLSLRPNEPGSRWSSASEISVLVKISCILLPSNPFVAPCNVTETIQVYEWNGPNTEPDKHRECALL